VQFATQGLNVLLNIILNRAVIGGCGKLCGHLKSKPGQEACDLVCSVVGMKAFIKALNHTDLDPIYFCELAHACEAGPDDAHVDLVSVQLSPQTVSEKDVQPGTSGVTVEATLTVNVTKATGVGEFAVDVNGPVAGAEGPIGGAFTLADGLTEGVQNIGVKLPVGDTDSVTWTPGSYEVRFHVCQGKCGSKHPHSIDFGRQASNFTISKGKEIVV
jgi:hypothetical protein